MTCVKSIKVSHKDVLNTPVYTYRRCQKEIDLFKRKAQFDKHFFICRVTAEYDLSCETLKGHMFIARERHKAHAVAQRFTTEQEKMIAF